LFPSLASELPRVPIEPLKHSLRGDFVCTIAHRAFPQVSQQSVDEKPASVVELAKTISEQAGRLANADPGKFFIFCIISMISFILFSFSIQS
jgi:hypothetical protein